MRQSACQIGHPPEGRAGYYCDCGGAFLSDNAATDCQAVCLSDSSLACRSVTQKWDMIAAAAAYLHLTILLLTVRQHYCLHVSHTEVGHHCSCGSIPPPNASVTVSQTVQSPSDCQTAPLTCRSATQKWDIIAAAAAHLRLTLLRVPAEAQQPLKISRGGGPDTSAAPGTEVLLDMLGADLAPLDLWLSYMFEHSEP